MTLGSELDPELRRFLEQLRADWAQYPPLDSMEFPERRVVAEKVRARWRQGGPEMARTIERTFDTGAGQLRIRIHVPKGAPEPAPALIYLHGGGFTLFSIDTHDRLMREYAERGGFVVVGADYPLSPEYKYPVALDRIEALMLWLGDHGGELGIDPRRMAMGGDSAGANLSIATTLRLRERGAIGLVRAILSNYGFFTAEISDEAEARFGGPGAIMDRSEAQQYYANYLKHPAEALDPSACPIHADLTGFPSVFLVIPECDLVAEHSTAMAARLCAAGVETRAKVYPGAIHSFLEAMSISALARGAIADGAAFLRDRLR